MEYLWLVVVGAAWIGSCIGLYLYGYTTGYQATNETIVSIVDKRVEQIVTASRAKVSV